MFVNNIRFSTCTASWCFVRWPFWFTWASFWRNYFTWKRLCLYITTIQQMYCLLVFPKMPFTIHFIFTPLTGKIFWPLFTTFCSCFDMIVLKNHSFFVLSTWYCTWCLMNFFLLIKLFSHALQFHAHLNCFPHFMNLSMLNSF